MDKKKNFFLKKILFLIIILFLRISNVFANGIPTKWQIAFQESASPVMDKVTEFHNFLFLIQCIIALLVSLFLIFIIYRFRLSKNKASSKVAHNTFLEIMWTVVPLVVIFFIMFPSLKLIYFMDIVPKADMTLKAIGHQWYWSYEYPDNGNISFDSYMIKDEDIKPNQLRLLSTDNPVYLPTKTTIRILTTSDDVIHSWAVPALGVKKDSVPGRLNETWIRIHKEGTYFGQCSEFCGPGHAFMPIEIKAVSPQKFKKWANEKNKE